VLFDKPIGALHYWVPWSAPMLQRMLLASILFVVIVLGQECENDCMPRFALDWNPRARQSLVCACCRLSQWALHRGALSLPSWVER
jgi:hypothetical protein